MTLLLVTTIGFFIWTAHRRWKLMMIGPSEKRFDQIGKRISLTIKYAFGQVRMPRFFGSGIAHIFVFFGFLVLLLRSLILWGRGYVEDFDMFIFGADQPLGMIYAVLKDTFILIVIIGVIMFFYYRVIKRLPRLTLHFEGTLILLIIFVMMVADIIYDGARMNSSGEFHKTEYAGYFTAWLLKDFSPGSLILLKHIGFWTHSSLVLIFLNILPYSKHFHIITAIPNVFFQNLNHPGRLDPIMDMEEKIEREETLGVATIDNFNWKEIMDMYTCTECGRCTEMCPAASTGKILSPKMLICDLRDHLYSRQNEVMKLKQVSDSCCESEEENACNSNGSKLEPIPLVSDEIINPQALWACTTCRACEQECPVFNTHVNKIVDMRRNLVMEQGTFPDELQNLFRGLETAGNPWSYPPDDRMQWAEGLDVPVASDNPDFEILFWVGCAPAFDARAKNTTIAFTKLLKKAEVNFACLGLEETCTGDAARRAGNEFLFQMMAQQNVETMNNYNVKKIVTTCPHCYNMLKNEYGDFGGHYEVIHHTELLADLLKHGKLKPAQEVKAKVVFHDSCYLGRYNDIYSQPRDILKQIPGLTIVEPELSHDRGMCCGAGGAQMFKEEEEGKKRINNERTQQLIKVLDSNQKGETEMISSACPFCMTMLSDSLGDEEREEIQQLDVAQILCQSVIGD